MHDNMSLLETTLQDVLKNGIPRSTSQPALAARRAANDLLEWMKGDSSAGRLFFVRGSVTRQWTKQFRLTLPTHKLAVKGCGACSTVFEHPMNTNASGQNFWRNR